MKSPFGFVVINKPIGITSHDCVKRLRKIFELKKIGHGGTLDPAVSGVLPIAIGQATRLLPYLPSSKTYLGTIRLGIQTNTDDLEGEIISSKEWPRLESSSLEIVLENFRGLINQSPPIFSSVHLKGERAYKKARRGETFSLPPKKVNIHSLKLLEWEESTGHLKIFVHCSSGTYIRSLARDIGNQIGCGGVLVKLERTQALGFTTKDAIPLPEITQNTIIVRPNIINPLKYLNHLPQLKLADNHEIDAWRKGQSLQISSNRIENPSKEITNEETKEEESLLIINLEGTLIGIAKRINPEQIQPKVVFNALS